MEIKNFENNDSFKLSDIYYLRLVREVTLAKKELIVIGEYEIQLNPSDDGLITKIRDLLKIIETSDLINLHDLELISSGSLLVIKNKNAEISILNIIKRLKDFSLLVYKHNLGIS